MQAMQPTREKDAKEANVSVERIVDCPFSLAVGEADVIFPKLESQCNGGGIRIPYRTLGTNNQRSPQQNHGLTLEER